jgi:tRNA A-37 threonylcarbamoyl transferase component Bud32
MDQTQVIQQEGRRWWIRPDAAAPLLADGRLTACPERLTAIKQGASRTVSRCEAGGVTFYVKRYAAGGLGRRLRAWFGLGPGRREWNMLLAARAAGLDVPEPAALGHGAEEVLITREIHDAQRLDDYLFDRYFEPLAGDPPYPGARPPELIAVFRRRRIPPAGTIDPRTLAYCLADLVARLAEADLYLPDLHPGNILIAGPPGGWRLSLVDLADAVSPAPPEATLQHLLELEHFFEPLATASERLRCLQRLQELWPETPSAREVARATAAYRQRFYRHRDRRTRRESKYFRRLAVGEWRGWATADWVKTMESLLGAKGNDPCWGTAAILKEGRTSTVWRETLDDGRTLILKRHNRAVERGTIHRILRPSRSLAAFRRGHALLARGIATARPAAAVECTKDTARYETLLATEDLRDGEPLSDWLRREPPPADRRHVTWELARMVRRLHDMGFSHRDLKSPNFLVTPARGPASQRGRGPRPRVFLVDLDGLRGDRRVSPHRRAQNLMRLSVSLDEWGVARRTDRLRFLRTYLGRRGCPSAITIRSRRRGATEAARRLRRWWKRISRLSARKWATLRRKQETGNHR